MGADVRVARVALGHARVGARSPVVWRATTSISSLRAAVAGSTIMAREQVFRVHAQAAAGEQGW